MPIGTLLRTLDQHRVRYVVSRHSVAYTAQAIAEAAHVSGTLVAKTVIVSLDGRLAMAVLRATDRIDLDLLRSAAHATRCELATESDFAGRFPGVEVGAMPPFGNLYGMDVYVDDTLARDHDISFNCGTHAELMRLAYADFERIVHPHRARFSSD